MKEEEEKSWKVIRFTFRIDMDGKITTMIRKVMYK